ncbi:MAG: lipopolysaccharide biosynthesis protein [Ardenticatenaceae bacterium]
METSKKKNLARTTVLGTLWTYAAHYSGKLMVFVSTIILARLLLQEDFGVAGYALVVINFLDVLNDLGIGSALIYYPEERETSDTAFWLGFAVSLTLLAACWLMAPLVGDFFNDPRAVPVVRVLALTFPLSAFGNVHRMLLLKGLAFRRKFIPDVSKALSKGLISIALAASGFGAWSLIWGQIGGTLIAVIALWWVLPWRPRFHFAPDKARLLLSYGLNIVAVNIVAVLILNVDYLFIGRALGAGPLGIYTLAFRIPELVIMQFCNVITRVMFPVYAKMRSESQSLSRGFLTITRYISLITIPLGLGMALVAEPFVLTVFTEKWLDAIPVMRAISIYALFTSLYYSAGDIYKVQGQPSVLTKLGILNLIILVPALWGSTFVSGSIVAIAWTQAAVTFFMMGIRLFVACRMLDTPFKMVLSALQAGAVGGAIMSLAVSGILLISPSLPPLAQLILAVLVGGSAYVAALWWLQRDVVMMASQTLRSAFNV